jgi:hypothetical protein
MSCDFVFFQILEYHFTQILPHLPDHIHIACLVNAIELGRDTIYTPVAILLSAIQAAIQQQTYTVGH